MQAINTTQPDDGHQQVKRLLLIPAKVRVATTPRSTINVGNLRRDGRSLSLIRSAAEIFRRSALQHGFKLGVRLLRRRARLICPSTKPPAPLPIQICILPSDQRFHQQRIIKSGAFPRPMVPANSDGVTPMIVNAALFRLSVYR